jgi:hypothetical protein
MPVTAGPSAFAAPVGSAPASPLAGQLDNSGYIISQQSVAPPGSPASAASSGYGVMPVTAGPSASAAPVGSAPASPLAAPLGSDGYTVTDHDRVAGGASAPASAVSSGYGVMPVTAGPSASAAPASSAPASPLAAPLGSDGYTVTDHDRAAGNAAASSAPAPAPGPQFEMKSMLAGMTSFDTRVLPPQERMQTALPSRTFYADTDKKREPYARKFDEQGKMRNADGSALNTIGAERPAAIGAKGDRHIFVMDGQGQIYSADAIQENKDRAKKARESGESVQERFHHSSFLAGEDVAGAGELQVRDGQVELISDTSGHYRPGSKQMIQAVQQMEKNNVPVERLGVEFVGKSQGQGALQASAVELLGYQNHNPEEAETQMRAMHAKKDQVLAQIASLGQRAADGANLEPSKINSPAQASEGETVYTDPTDEPAYADLSDVLLNAERDDFEEASYNNV